MKSRRIVNELRADITRLHHENAALRSRLYDVEAAHRVLQGDDATYWALVTRIRHVVHELVPRDRTVLVVSKGDPTLVDLYGREAWHFPRAADGRYAGYYPKRALSAIAHLEALRARGADYLLIPKASAWWLDHYPAFEAHLAARYRRLDVEEVCVLYSLREPAEQNDTSGIPWLSKLVADHAPVLGDAPSLLDWDTGADLAAVLHGVTVFSPREAPSESLPYLDASVDIVAVSTGDEDVVREAERVAAKLVVNLHGVPRGRKRATRRIVWKVEHAPRGAPSVSIVIPCHDGIEYTSACIASLRETLPPWFSGEIIVVDDASSDGTGAYLERAALSNRPVRVRHIRNRSNVGFLESCNRGARAARGDYLLFLNNDTVLLPGWLAPLLRTFADFPDAGAVGGKLLFEDGTLQEAGALVFADGSAAKIGYRDPDVQAPIYEYVRETDYVSGAFLMTPRRLFREVGGLDSRYGFGYYDDDDYCFAVRAAGRRVYYQPESAIVHVEGASAGTDPTRGLKRNQIANQAVFAEKWSRLLRHQPARPDVLDWSSLQAIESARVGAATQNGR